jgi:hypothetical protein
MLVTLQIHQQMWLVKHLTIDLLLLCFAAELCSMWRQLLGAGAGMLPVSAP